MKRISLKLQPYFKKNWFYAITVLITMLVAYGLQIKRLGFFWDDWQVIYLSRFKDFTVFWDFFLYDRPFSIWTYFVTLPFLSVDPIRWQIFTLLVRLSSVLAFCWTLRGIWPEHEWQIRWMGLLFAIYPGFTQQAISVAYSQHFITYALFLVSLGLMVYVLQGRGKYIWLTSIALLLSAVQLLTMEYFLGLELIRPLIIWLVIDKNDDNRKKRIWKTLKHWFPYIVIWLLFLIWRFFLYRLISPFDVDPNSPVLLEKMINSPINSIINLAQVAIQDIIHSGLLVWINTIHPDVIQLFAKFSVFSWIIGLLLAGLIVWFMIFTDVSGSGEGQTPNEGNFHRESLIMSAASIVLAGLPVWIMNRQAMVGMWSDRFTLPVMFGIVIFIVSFVDWLGGLKNRKAILLGLLLGLSVASHMRTINKYRANWELQQNYFWQVYWRIPDLKQGSAILGPELPFSYISGISLGFAYNTIYDLEPASMDVPYWFIEALRYQGSKTLPEMEENVPMQYDELRNILYEGSTSDSVAVNYNASRGCVRVLDPIYKDAPSLSPYPISEGETQLFDISHVDQIQLEYRQDKMLMTKLFGKEPEQDWCYYFERGDLARQYKDWEKVAALMTEAEDLDLEPNNGVELIPFIEGFAHQGMWVKALQYTREANEISADMNAVLCSSWKRIDDDTDDSSQKQESTEEINSYLSCD